MVLQIRDNTYLNIQWGRWKRFFLCDNDEWWWMMKTVFCVAVVSLQSNRPIGAKHGSPTVIEIVPDPQTSNKICLFRAVLFYGVLGIS